MKEYIKLKENNKNSIDFIDNITERKMKCIILLCVFLCLFCEFVPDMIDICKLFNYCKLIVLLQPHKNFFTNIALGCLGSAVISHAMLYIQIKIKENDKKEKIKVLFRNTLSEYYKIYYRLENIENNDMIDKVGEYIKESNQVLKTNLKNIIDMDINLDDTQNELYKIFINELFSLSKEIKVFFDVLEEYNFSDIPKEEFYNKDFYFILLKAIYRDLFDILDEKFNLKVLNEKIITLCMPLNIPTKILEQNKKEIEDILESQKEAVSHLTYSNIINKTFQNVSERFGDI